MARGLDRRAFLKLAAGAAGGAALPGLTIACRRRQETPRLVLLYATCSVNADYLAPYNPTIAFTPALARFAASAARLERHQTEAGQSGIAYASIFTGVQADRHGIYDHPHQLRPELELVTELFADAGYDPYFWGGHLMAGYDLGYGQGVPPEHHRPRLLEADDPLFAELLERLDRDPGYRAFVLTDFTVTHMKYAHNPAYFDEPSRSLETLPDEAARLGLDAGRFAEHRRLFYDGASDFELCGALAAACRRWGLSNAEAASFREVVDYLYRCAVHRLDTLFGEVVARLEQAHLLDESLLVFTADHGETLARPGTFLTYAHGFQLAPEVLRVPCLIRAPSLGVTPGPRAFVTRSIDLLPTLAGLCRVPPPAEAEGVDLAPVLRGRAPVPELVAPSHTSLVPRAIVDLPEYEGSVLRRLFPRRDPELMWVALRSGDRLARLAKKSPDGAIEPAVYDLAADPEARADRFDGRDPEQRALVARLEAYKRRLVAAYFRRAPGEGDELDEQERIERLRALGYI